MTGFVRKFRKSKIMMDGFEEFACEAFIALAQTLLASLRKSGPHVAHVCRSVEGVCDASEANFKAKASKQGPADIGGRWIVVITYKRRIRSP
jgi:hypothetical protein